MREIQSREDARHDRQRFTRFAIRNSAETIIEAIATSAINVLTRDNMRQNFKGIVVSAMNPKTVKVRTMIQMRHPKVLKVVLLVFSSLHHHLYE